MILSILDILAQIVTVMRPSFEPGGYLQFQLGGTVGYLNVTSLPPELFGRSPIKAAQLISTR